LSFRICGVYTKAVTRKLSDSSVYTQSEFSGDRGGYIVLGSNEASVNCEIRMQFFFKSLKELKKVKICHPKRTWRRKPRKRKLDLDRRRGRTPFRSCTVICILMALNGKVSKTNTRTFESYLSNRYLDKHRLAYCPTKKMFSSRSSVLPLSSFSYQFCRNLNSILQ
jgi:hypothetical protein